MLRAIRRIGSGLLLASRVRRRLLRVLLRPLFGTHGRNFWFDPDGTYSFRNIYVGDNVFLGLRPTLNATRSKIVIGSNVMFGPDVVVRGGNHTTTIVGRFMSDITDPEKRPEDDLGVVIDDDVWVGTRAVILHGVTVGRGSIIAAGAVVTKSVPAYTVVGGVPAKVLKFRWDPDTIVEHERVLYSAERRFSRDALVRIQSEARRC